MNMVQSALNGKSVRWLDVSWGNMNIVPSSEWKDVIFSQLVAQGVKCSGKAPRRLFP